MVNFLAISKVLVDILLLCVALGPSIYLKLFVTPVKGGFNCSDESIHRIFKGETYPLYSLLIIALVVPVTLIWLIETFKKGSIYTTLITYILGLHTLISLVQILKFSVGRPRPIFMEWCQPVLPDGSSCKDSQNQNQFIEDIICQNPNQRRGVQSRLSFPSGHAAISVYALTYIVLYLHVRVSFEISVLLKHFLQFICLSFAVSICASRVADHMHFISDVLVGVGIGISFAIWVVFYVSDLTKVRSVITFDNVRR